MKKISLQWRLTIMTALLIAITCIALNLLLYRTGTFYIDSLENSVLDYGNDTEELYIDIPEKNWEDFASQFSVQIQDSKTGYGMNGWIITIIITILSGAITYFISGRALKPLHDFSRQVEQVQVQNLTESTITENGVPEFQKLSHSFNQMLLRLSDAFAAQREFTGNAAHEFRTPLALMQAKLDLYAATPHPDDSPETVETIKMMQEQTERLSRLIKTLLDLSELTTVPHTDRIELAPLVEEVLTDLTPLAEKRSITLSQDCPDNLFLMGSDILIYRLLFNLVENAIRYNNDNGFVNISVTESGKQIAISVSDTGSGISSAYLESVFEPFFRIDKSRSRELGGVGLGLALVKKITELHDGTVTVASSSEKGTCFKVILPAAR